VIETPGRPLVTFVLLAYNQERYIREAVEAALAQEYSPLEIILSDDCSTDRTFAIIASIAKIYGGANKVRLNRNDRNLGISGHINKIMSLSHGEIVVVAAGDDISIPCRTAALVDAWCQRHRVPDLLCSAYSSMDMDGKPLSEGAGCRIEEMNSHAMAKNGHGVVGATAAWTKRVWDRFGLLPESIIYEDQILPFRAMLSGGVVYLDKPLVRYRRGVSTWISRTATISHDEMRRRNASLCRYALQVGEVQRADAQFGGRHELVPFIDRRINRCRTADAIFAGRISMGASILMVVRNRAVSILVMRAFMQVYLPAAHALVLRLKELWRKLRLDRTA
jgi:glycosyltransferase involved in cell wall biosynthesis